MRIMFMGTPEFAIPCLEKLIIYHDVDVVVTQPDKPKGRGQKFVFPPVKAFALEKGIEVLQPDTLKNEGFLPELKTYNPDVIIVVAYGKILPQYILSYPQYGCINLHGSLLPKYRGAAPIQWAVANGEKESGVCTMMMEAGLDTGAVYEVAKTDINEDETAGELYKRLSIIGADLMISTLSKLPDIKAISQDDSQSTYASMITKETARINWNDEAEKIVSLIHAMNPSPKAHTTLNGEPFKILRAHLGNGKAEPGKILGLDKGEGLEVGCAKGTLYIREIQSSSGKQMKIEDYLRGHKLEGYFI